MSKHRSFAEGFFEVPDEWQIKDEETLANRWRKIH